MTITLGDKVKDPITGLVGIAIGKTHWLHGCDRVIIQPEGFGKDKKPFETFSVDEPQLVVLTKKKVPLGSRKTGGPRPTPSPKAHQTK